MNMERKVRSKKIIKKENTHTISNVECFFENTLPVIVGDIILICEVVSSLPLPLSSLPLPLLSVILKENYDLIWSLDRRKYRSTQAYRSFSITTGLSVSLIGT
jgi:hypothetical protein